MSLSGTHKLLLLQESEDEVDSEEDSTEEEGSEGSNEPRAEDTVSINSDSEDPDENSQESQSKRKSDDVIILQNDQRLENRNGGNTRESHSPEIHEIVSDNEDFMLRNDEKSNTSISKVKVEPLRRSSRVITRKKYDDDAENGDDESDIEEVAMEDPLNQFHGKNKPIVVNDTKTLVEMAAKQMKSNQGNNQKKEPTVVIIDTNSILSGKGPLPIQQAKNSVSTSSSSALNAQNLYQSIAARGTTVTPVSSKNLTNTNAQSSTPPSILPSLTDDMFVVEAPSFIVPYVYEKPSIKPFREFVDILGKDLEEQRAKEEQIKLEKEKEQKAVIEKMKKEQGEVVEDMEVDIPEKQSKSPEEIEEEVHKKKKLDKKGNFNFNFTVRDYSE